LVEGRAVTSAAAAFDFELRSDFGVLAAHVAERNRAVQRRRMDGGRDDAHFFPSRTVWLR
jgi:hypothetical protein